MSDFQNFIYCFEIFRTFLKTFTATFFVSLVPISINDLKEKTVRFFSAVAFQSPLTIIVVVTAFWGFVLNIYTRSLSPAILLKHS